MVPSQGRRLPTMRLRSVDLPAPFAPRMAIRESMLNGCHTVKTEKAKTSTNSLDTKGKFFIEVISLLAGIRESDVVERNDWRREPIDILKVEAERR